MTEDDPAAEKRTAVECLTFGPKIAKRVTWEEWEFTVVGPHQVRVTNAAVEFDSPTADETSGPETVADELVADGGVPAAVDSPTVDACPNGDPRCDGPAGVGLECFACYRPEGSE